MLGLVKSTPTGTTVYSSAVSPMPHSVRPAAPVCAKTARPASRSPSGLANSATSSPPCTTRPRRHGQDVPQLGLRLTYEPDKQIIRAAVRPQPENLGKWLASEAQVNPSSDALTMADNLEVHRKE